MLILNFHNVLVGPLDQFDRSQETRLDVESFETLIDRLLIRYRIVGLNELLGCLGDPQADNGMMALSFDDGYRGVLTNAWPILARRGLTASVFVVTQALDPDPCLFHFEELEVAFRVTTTSDLGLGILGPDHLPLSSTQERCRGLKSLKQRLKLLPEPARRRVHSETLERLGVSPERCLEEARGNERFEKIGPADLHLLRDAGWIVGSHTRTHRTLSCLSPDELKDEIFGSLEDLGRHSFLAPMTFAYPYGRPHHIGPDAPGVVASAGYNRAMTMIDGPNKYSTDPYLIHRIDARDSHRLLS